MRHLLPSGGAPNSAQKRPSDEIAVRHPARSPPRNQVIMAMHMFATRLGPCVLKQNSHRPSAGRCSGCRRDRPALLRKVSRQGPNPPMDKFRSAHDPDTNAIPATLTKRFPSPPRHQSSGSWLPTSWKRISSLPGFNLLPYNTRQVRQRCPSSSGDRSARVAWELLRRSGPRHHWSIDHPLPREACSPGGCWAFSHLTSRDSWGD